MVIVGLVCVITGCTASEPVTQQGAVLPPAQLARHVQQCMSARGWEVKVEEDGSVGGFIPNGQEDQYDEAKNACFDEVRSPSFDEYPEADRRRVYDAFLVTRTCLIDQGYPLDDPPSYQSWTESKGQWNPYNQLPETMTAGEQVRLEAACPPRHA